MFLPVPLSGPDGAQEWFDSFTRKFRSDAGNIRTEIGVMYHRREECRPVWNYSGQEWSDNMSSFLSRFALQLGYFQEWQMSKRRYDFTWYIGKGGKERVVIEHENDPYSTKASEVPKLLKSVAPLRVLITYSNGNPRALDGLLTSTGAVIRKHWRGRTNGEFLLVVGKDQVFNPSSWIGFRWKENAGMYQWLTKECKEQECAECGVPFKPWSRNEGWCVDCERQHWHG